MNIECLPIFYFPFSFLHQSSGFSALGKPIVEAYTCNPSTHEAKAGSSPQVGGQCELQSETLSQNTNIEQFLLFFLEHFHLFLWLNLFLSFLLLFSIAIVNGIALSFCVSGNSLLARCGSPGFCLFLVVLGTGSMRSRFRLSCPLLMLPVLCVDFISWDFAELIYSGSFLGGILGFACVRSSVCSSSLASFFLSEILASFSCVLALPGLCWIEV